MSYIVRVGNLTGEPRVVTTPGAGEFVAATVAVNDSFQAPDGEWQSGPVTYYRLSIRGRAGARLIDFQANSGNRRVVFAGSYRVTSWVGDDGQTRRSHEVWVDHIGVDLASQDVVTLDGEIAPEDLDVS